MRSAQLATLRAEIEEVNFALLELLSRRGRLVMDIHRVKSREGIPIHLPDREQQMLADLVKRNRGPFSDETVRELFKQILRASVDLMETRRERDLQVSRARRPADLHVAVGDRVVGRAPVVIAGPCAVESEEQMDETGRFLSSRGVRFLRGGAFKPRSSPYSFQGLGAAGLKLLRATADRYGMLVVTEVMDPRDVELCAGQADVLQVGSRNMYNYDLLRELGHVARPVLLKRGLSATLDELLWSAEYVVSGGNESVILCERGIRTYERETRNTLDLSAVPLLRAKSFLPVIVDLSHALGRRDILAPMGRAALAAGANGLMVEVHPSPALARSDSQQQLDFEGFDRFLHETELTGYAEHAGVTTSTWGAKASDSPDWQVATRQCEAGSPT
ncbi:MAG: bifunctional 3-deoxy-7-phosphoheptulonate synthase/chorismate mutase [Deltaproteobacteria bacterium]|nr:bifunctional 3-deoxy-7-phosphoheptulonate synthase/chorismate mutase [Deltaproteobacteria bacterium]